MRNVRECCLFGLMLLAGTAASARTVEIVGTNVVNDVITSVDLAFGPAAAGETNRLFAVWGPTDGGDGVDGWAQSAFAVVVPPDMTSYRCAMPPDWDTVHRAIRFYLVSRGTAYDWRVEYLQSTGAEYVNTGVLHTPTSVVDCVLTTLDPPVGSYNVPFGTRHAVIGGTYPNALYCFTRYGNENKLGFARGHSKLESFGGVNAVQTGTPLAIHIEGFSST